MSRFLKAFQCSIFKSIENDGISKAAKIILVETAYVCVLVFRLVLELVCLLVSVLVCVIVSGPLFCSFFCIFVYVHVLLLVCALILVNFSL